MLFCNHLRRENGISNESIQAAISQPTASLTPSRHMNPSSLGIEVATATMFCFDSFVPCKLNKLYSGLTSLPV
jgi:hypothetical protein